MSRGPATAALGAAVAALTLLAAAPAGAQDGEGSAPAAQAPLGDARNGEPDDRFALTGGAVVAREEVVGDLVVIEGDVKIAGTVRGDVIAGDGDVLVSGVVDGDLTTVLGRAQLLPGARVGGDVAYGDEAPIVAGGAVVEGEVRDEDFADFADATWAAAIGAVALWIGVTASLLVLGIAMAALFPNAMEASSRAAHDSAGPSIGVGIGLVVGLPILAVVSLISLVGFPLGLGALAALLPLSGIAYVAASFILGRAVTGGETHPILAFLAGFGILRAIAIVPVLGTIFWLAAVVFGLGALAIAAWRAGGADAPATG